ncbi:hypothetical protein L9F63_006461, partial [Diploptera punctata]
NNTFQHKECVHSTIQTKTFALRNFRMLARLDTSIYIYNFYRFDLDTTNYGPLWNISQQTFHLSSVKFTFHCKHFRVAIIADTAWSELYLLRYTWNF